MSVIVLPNVEVTSTRSVVDEVSIISLLNCKNLDTVSSVVVVSTIVLPNVEVTSTRSVVDAVSVIVLPKIVLVTGTVSSIDIESTILLTNAVETFT